MKLLCLTSQLERPSTRYRLLQYLPYLHDAGIETKVMAVQGAGRRWLLLLGKEIKEYQGIFIQKKLFSQAELAYLRYLTRRNGQKIIYDFDDAVMHSKDPGKSSARRARRFKATAATAGLLIAGNQYLSSQVRGEDAAKVRVVPTVLSVSQYPSKDYSSRGNKVVIGWLGTSSTLSYLRLIEPVLKSIGERYPQVILKVISDRQPALAVRQLAYEQWQRDKEGEQLAGIDIGLMPLPQDSWAQGKCGFKLIQYLAAGIPAVASAVGVNNQIIQQGSSGFLASSLDEWEEKLKQLIENVDLRRQFGLAGRQTMEEKYNLSCWGPKVAEMIRELLIK